MGPHAVPQALGQTGVQVGQVGARGAQGRTQQPHPLQLGGGPTPHNHLAHRDRVGDSNSDSENGLGGPTEHNHLAHRDRVGDSNSDSENGPGH